MELSFSVGVESTKISLDRAKLFELVSCVSNLSIYSRKQKSRDERMQAIPTFPHFHF